MEALNKLITLQVVVGVIFNSNHQILISRRPLDKYKGGLWEFPGGKIEKDESIFAALQRELQEEIGIDVISAEPWLLFSHDYGDRLVHLNTWRITEFKGEAHGREGQSIVWVDAMELDQYTFPAGNVEIIKKIQQVSDSK